MKKQTLRVASIPYHGATISSWLIHSARIAPWKFQSATEHVSFNEHLRIFLLKGILQVNKETLNTNGFFIWMQTKSLLLN